MLYVYVIFGTKFFVTVNEKSLKIGLTSNPDKAAFWTSKKTAKTWGAYIKKRFESAELKRATLKVVE